MACFKSSIKNKKMNFTKTNGNTELEYFNIHFKKKWIPSLHFTLTDIFKIGFYIIYSISLTLGILLSLIILGNKLWNYQAKDVIAEISSLRKDVNRIDSNFTILNNRHIQENLDTLNRSKIKK